MKIAVNIARILTGLLFIFSGLVKAIDPRGLAYKMQEFFEAWAHAGFMPGLMNSLGNYALSFSIIMITLEVIVGLALLLGWQKKFTTWILLLLILFFTFLTSYVLFSGKIRACGCFGDCIPITPVQTFTKDIILLVMSLLLLVKRNYINTLLKPFTAGIIILITTVGTLLLQWYVLRSLPVVDCLPYKKGNNLLELRKMPANAIPDKYAMSFVYQKNGEKKEYTAENLPDSSWEFVDRKQSLVEAGKNNVPLINDFSLITETGNDTTQALLSQPGNYYILYIKDLDALPKNFNADQALVAEANTAGVPFVIVTSQKEKVQQKFGSTATILTCDATALKTAARAHAVLYKMKGPLVQDKWGWPAFDKVKIEK
ncbi:MAG: DoxX family membrane protein [Sphingobacteriales bacterium]|nr:MAG: DoxX family membrane protein [Sphingobacteriales bacterium]